MAFAFICYCTRNKVPHFVYTLLSAIKDDSKPACVTDHFIFALENNELLFMYNIYIIMLYPFIQYNKNSSNITFLLWTDPLITYLITHSLHIFHYFFIYNFYSLQTHKIVQLFMSRSIDRLSLFTMFEGTTCRWNRLRFYETRAVQCDYRVSHTEWRKLCIHHRTPNSEADWRVGGRLVVVQSVAGNDDISSNRVDFSHIDNPTSCRPSDTLRAL